MKGRTALTIYHFGNTVTCDMADGEIAACSVLDIRDWTQIQPRKYSNNSHRTFELKVVSDFSLTQDKYFCIYKKARQHFFRNDAGSVSSVSAEWTVYTRAVNEPSEEASTQGVGRKHEYLRQGVGVL